MRLVYQLAIGFCCAACWIAASQPSAACTSIQKGFCVDQIVRFVAVEADTDGGFLALGDDGQNAHPGRIYVSHLSPQAVPLSPPKEVDIGHIEGALSVEARDIVALDDGSFLILGQVIIDDHVRVWAARIKETGDVVWWKMAPVEDSQTDEILYRAEQLSDGRVLAVGRRQSGPGDSTCTNWSRGLLAWLPIEDGDPFRLEALRYEPEMRRTALYALEEDDDGNLLLAGWESRPKGEGLCQDDVVIFRTHAKNPQVFQYQVWGEPVEDEIGYGIESGGRLADGMAVVVLAKQPTVLIARVDDDDQLWLPSTNAVDELVKRDDADGRLTVAVRVGGGRHLAAGRYKSERTSLLRAWWHIFDGNRLLDSREVSAPEASSIVDIASGFQGTVVGVGDGRAEESGRDKAWACVIYQYQPEPAPLGLAGLPKLPPSGTGLPAVGTTMQKYSGPALPARQLLSVRFKVEEEGNIRLALVPRGGDLDISLSTSDSILLGFSQNTKEATELIEAKVYPGEYEATIVALEPVAGFSLELELRRNQNGAAASIPWNERMVYRTLLARSGYQVGPSARLGIGGALTRAVSAATSASDGRANWRRGEMRPPSN